MFCVGANCDVGLEVPARQRIWQFAADLEMTKLFAVSEEIEDEDFHVLSFESKNPPCWRNYSPGYDAIYRLAKTEEKIPCM